MVYKCTVFKDKQNQWRWHIKARNGKIVACSGEGFVSKHNARRSLGLIIHR